MLQQDVHRIEHNLYRVINGYYFIDINNTTYKVIYPDNIVKYNAQKLYLDLVEDNKYDNRWYASNQINFILDQQGIWNREKQNFLEQQEKILETEKIALYQNYTNQDRKKSHKKSIEILNKSINSMIQEKTSLDYLTLHFFAETTKYEFIIMHCIYDTKYNKKVFNSSSIDNSKYQNIQKISKAVLAQQLNTSDLRNIAKSDLWQSYYSEDRTFPVCSSLQNDDQRHLIRLTKMYESVRQHPDAPSDEVILDDDALDGWFLFQKAKSQQEKNKNQIMDRIGGSNNMNKAGELFVVTNDLGESRTIHNLNDAKTKQDLARTKQIAQSKGSVKWTDLDHVIQNKLREEGKDGYDKVKGDIK